MSAPRARVVGHGYSSRDGTREVESAVPNFEDRKRGEGNDGAEEKCFLRAGATGDEGRPDRGLARRMMRNRRRLSGADAQADREAPPARRRELKVLAVERVRQVLDREGEGQPIARRASSSTPQPSRCTVNPSSDSRSCAMRNGELSSVGVTRVTSVCVRTPYSTHQRPRGSVNRAAASTLTGVMLSAGVAVERAAVQRIDAARDRAAREGAGRAQRQHARA